MSNARPLIPNICGQAIPLSKLSDSRRIGCWRRNAITQEAAVVLSPSATFRHAAAWNASSRLQRRTRPRAAARQGHRRCSAASPDWPFVHHAAFPEGEGRQSGTFLPFAASAQNLLAVAASATQRADGDVRCAMHQRQQLLSQRQSKLG